MTEAKDKTAAGIQLCAELVKNLRGMCQGVHVMAIGWEKKVPDILSAAGIK
jgi:5,10-methylenetetrahydrofolate reductase